MEVSAPDTLSFEGVWNSVNHWLRDRYSVGHGWSEENLEFVHKAAVRAASMSFLQLCKEHDMKIIPVPEDAEDYETDDEADCQVIDVGGRLTKLKAELESGPGDQGNCDKFQGPHDLKGDLGNGIKIRLCNSILATEVHQELTNHYPQQHC